MKYGTYTHGMKLIEESKPTSGLMYFAQNSGNKKGIELVEKLEKKLETPLVDIDHDCRMSTHGYCNICEIERAEFERDAQREEGLISNKLDGIGRA